ncbi:uncharacterized protein (DUF1697 family) [Kineosphaera limosa]|uniref:DUF1697 domain-containing protein n=1 Tax=Kineosphaera limosa NBRC 100340 TaxID=1184609 RepID=K6WM71_9MICO|nr:DUF1697 domain-containing protein [Kineosphaera limosa]NYE00929.1 uncharacterized protein (DUF1697 family) [Kineosphaera limosa]GAB94876.1 hypothetical protein KILIM_014_00110 [Kineosphaera limosa NBRC 100340]
MPAYVAFLRAINLGQTRKFAKGDLVAATQAAGATAVQSYLTSGNVLLTSPRTSAAEVAADLESAYEADRGFAVPTIVFPLAELPQLVATGDELLAANGPAAQFAVSLYAQAPEPAAVEAAHALAQEQRDAGEVADQVFVRDRAAFVLLRVDVHSSQLLRERAFADLGQGTMRTHDVLRRLCARWA